MRRLPLLCLLALTGSLLTPIAVDLRAQVSAPPVTPPATLTAQQMRADLLYLRNEWGPLNRGYTPEKRAAFERLLDDATAPGRTLTPVEFYLTIAEAVALPEQAHTSSTALGAAVFHRLPLRVWWFEEGLHILRASPEHARLVGARIERIGKLSAEETFRRMEKYLNGVAAWRRYRSVMQLINLELLHAVGATDDPAAATLGLVWPDGRREDVTLGAETSPYAGANTPMWQQSLQPDSAPETRWPHLLDGRADLPAAFRRRDDVALDWLAEGRVAHIRCNHVFGLDRNAPLPSKLYTVLEQIVRAPAAGAVVLDFRYNHGGDFMQIIFFMQGLGKLAEMRGLKIVTLGNRATLSAAIVALAMAELQTRGAAVQVGESLGDLNWFWAEGGSRDLPHSKVGVQYNDGFHDWGNGSTDLANHYWPSVLYGGAAGSLEPEVRVPMRFADYAAGRDVMLEAALDVARAR